MDISYISSEELLSLAHKFGNIGDTRNWAPFRRDEGGYSILPIDGIRYLYRGQTQRYSPCLPTLTRRVTKPARRLSELPESERNEVLGNFIRSHWYCSELDQHPTFKWFEAKQWHIPRIEFAQHYGMPTGLIDVTESLEIALFFATHEFVDGKPQVRKKGMGILYRLDWAQAEQHVSTRFKPIAIHPFHRPFRQLAWTCELSLGESFEMCPGLTAVEFQQDEDFGNQIRALAEAKGELLPADPMATIAQTINNTFELPIKIATDTLADICSDPNGLPNESVKSLLKLLANSGYRFTDNASPIIAGPLLSEIERQWEIDEPIWNTEINEGFQLLIVRQARSSINGQSGSWFENVQ
jgi:hypothetical protein